MWSVLRNELLEKMNNQHFDVIVIGGGITGAGILLDATTRGIHTILFEMQDFAAGTSSRSTKLIHGGLRYLKQFEVGLVAEVGKERAIVYENGPHVTTPEWMLLPIYEKGTFGRFSTSIGLRMYDYLAEVKKSERRKMLSAKETLLKEPILKREGLKGSGFYVEYRTDDARLTIEVIKKAVEKGATALNYTKVTDFIYKDGKVVGVMLVDQMTNIAYQVYAKKIINATGPWVDSLRKKDSTHDNKQLILTKGVHLVFDQGLFPLQQSVYFDTPDGRMIFAIPREGKVYVGTTDTLYEGDIANPKVSISDQDYIIEAINYIFPNIKVSKMDIESSWAGIRPLIQGKGNNLSEISRKDEIWVSKTGLITIAGGKLTGYRKMAEQVVDEVAKQLEKEYKKTFSTCCTKQLPISGGCAGGSSEFAKFLKLKSVEGTDYGLTEKQALQLVQMYGTNVDDVFKIAKEAKSLSDHYNISIEIFAQLMYSLENEMVVKIEDFILRRTGMLYFQINTLKKIKLSILEYFSDEFSWTKEEKLAAVDTYNQLLEDAVKPYK